MTDPLGDSGAANPKLKRWRVAYQKDIFALAQSFFTIAAIIAGGWWFWFQGQPFAKANTTLIVEDRRLLDTDWTLIAIAVKVENVGLRTIRLTQGDFRVGAVVPLPDPISKALPAAAVEGSAPHWEKVILPEIDDKAENLRVFLNAGETEHVLAEMQD